MAIIRSFAPEGTANGRPHQTHVDCRWQTVRTRDGGVMVQLNTYGSDSRRVKAQLSQTMQLDRDIARQLVACLRETFDL